MKRYYVIEPNRSLSSRLGIYWKQKCNFYIEVLKISTKDEKIKKC